MKKKYKATLSVIFETENDIPDTHMSGSGAEIDEQLETFVKNTPRTTDIDENNIQASVTIHRID